MDKVFAIGAMQSIHDKQIEIKPAVPRDQMPPARRGPPFVPQQQQQQQQQQAQQQGGRGAGVPFTGMGGRGPGNMPFGPQATQQQFRQQQPHQQAAAAAAAAYQQQAVMAQQYGIAPLQQSYLPQQLAQQQRYGANQRLQQQQPQQFGGMQQPQLNLGAPFHRGSSPQQARPGSASTQPFAPQQQPYGQQPQPGSATGFGAAGGSVAGRLNAAGYAGAAAAAMYSLGAGAGFPGLPGADLSGAAGAAPSAALYAAAAAQAQAQAQATQQQLNSLQQQMNGFPGAADMAAVTSKLGALSTHDVQGPGASGARTSSGGGFSLANPSAGLGAGASPFGPFPAGQQPGPAAFVAQQQQHQQPQAEVSSGFVGAEAGNVFGADTTGASPLSATPDFSAFDGSSFGAAPPPGWSS